MGARAQARRDRQRRDARPLPAPRDAVRGGRLRPLDERECDRIVAFAIDLLAKVGMADAPAHLRRRALEHGATISAHGRLCFPRTMIEDAVARAAKKVNLPGFEEAAGLTIGGRQVHLGTGGAAVQVLDAKQKGFRDSCLNDLYDIMRVVEASVNVRYAIRPLVARDLSAPFDLDVNTAFACMKATAKPIGVSFAAAAHLTPVVGMFDRALGGEGRFRTRPFCMAVIVHVVPPLRFAEEGCQVLEASLRAGMVPQICSAGQAGATSPVTLAGALGQGLAECLAGLMLIDLIKPGAPAVFAFLPFVSDLRSGAMTGGGGECAVANAAAAQLLQRLELPAAVSAGMTDAKIADAQAGYEKGYSVALAAQAGADMINLSVGMLGSIMVASPEMLAIDDDLCGAILRSVRGIEISDDAFDIEMVERVVTGEGHYLGEAQTLARMRSDYLYPKLADRRSVAEWLDDGGHSIWERAVVRVRDILSADPPSHLTRSAEDAIRDSLPITLAR